MREFELDARRNALLASGNPLGLNVHHHRAFELGQHVGRQGAELLALERALDGQLLEAEAKAPGLGQRPQNATHRADAQTANLGTARHHDRERDAALRTIGDFGVGRDLLAAGLDLGSAQGDLFGAGQRIQHGLQLIERDITAQTLGEHPIDREVIMRRIEVGLANAARDALGERHGQTLRRLARLNDEALEPERAMLDVERVLQSCCGRTSAHRRRVRCGRRCANHHRGRKAVVALRLVLSDNDDRLIGRDRRLDPPRLARWGLVTGRR